jgi:uncharacterized FlaG/YvyC family protein
MDVSATTSPQAQPLPAVAAGSPAQQPAPTPDQGRAGSAQVGATSRSGISPVVAKLFGAPGEQRRSIALHVSYRVATHPDEIVTVFTDPKTGQVIAQFPPEVLVQIAEFFDQQQGATLDRNA